MKRFFYIILAAALLVFSSCEKEPVNSGNNQQQGQQQGQEGQQGQGGQQGGQEEQVNWTYYFANYFAYDLMDYYYLWKKEVKSKMTAWSRDFNVEPIAKVASVKYKHATDSDLDDRWTQLTDDYKSFMGDVTGVTTTYGYDFYHFEQDENKYDRALATVRYTYPGSPAAEAGLKRGDVIVKVNGLDIPINFVGNSGYLDTDFIYREMVYSSSCTLELKTGEIIKMTAREMVENPVILYHILENEGRKIGYLHYTSFTAESCAYLIEACQYFKDEGVKELILDLRYNGGGAVVAEELFISMLAPRANVEAEDIFEKEIYNAEYSANRLKWYGEDANVSRFSFQHDFVFDDKDYHFNTSNANIGLEKIYAIVTEDSASASEALLCCLKPFYGDNLVIIGKQTHGKYCGGYIISSDDYFQDIKDQYNNPEYGFSAEEIAEANEFCAEGVKYASNWGLYVMVSSYSDRDGVTLCKPNGIKPDYVATDNPKDTHQLGDPEEPMLKTTLRRAGFTVASSSTEQAPERIVNIKTIPFNRREKPGMVREITSLPKQLRGPLKPQTSNDQYTRAE